MKLKKDVFVANEDLRGFYGSTIKKGTLLYPLHKQDKPIRHNGASHCRFVFDTVKGAKSHRYEPQNNIRISIWAVNGKFEENIS